MLNPAFRTLPDSCVLYIPWTAGPGGAPRLELSEDTAPESANAAETAGPADRFARAVLVPLRISAIYSREDMKNWSTYQNISAIDAKRPSAAATCLSSG